MPKAKQTERVSGAGLPPERLNTPGLNRPQPEARCDTCWHWHQRDLTPKRIDNVGTCSALMPTTPGFYDKNPTTPFWAQRLCGQTVSYEGKSCLAWRKRKGAKRANKNL